MKPLNSVTEHSADALCAAIAGAVRDRALARSRHAYVACHVVLAHRTVIVAGELGFWPPLGAFEGVCEELDGIVARTLEAAQAAGWPLAAPPGRYTVINRLQRLPTEQARHLAASLPGHDCAATRGTSMALGHAVIRADPRIPSVAAVSPVLPLIPRRRATLEAAREDADAVPDTRVVG